MIFVGSRVRRFQSAINDRRRCVSSTNKFEHVVRDDIRTGTRSERVQPITHPREFTHFQNLRLLEPEGLPNRVGVLIFDE